jgi:hypothetical protein
MTMIKIIGAMGRYNMKKRIDGETFRIISRKIVATFLSDGTSLAKKLVFALGCNQANVMGIHMFDNLL